jgi:RNase P subunit RPR2
MKKPSKHAARERINRLVDVALEMSSQDTVRSEAALTTALKILRKYNVRGVPLFKRYFYCHECKRVIIPGRTATVRVSSGKVKALSITCLKCGHAYRIPLIKKGNHKKDSVQSSATS